jgi:Mlc titration factor MtfA (ptsG expression regulator)
MLPIFAILGGVALVIWLSIVIKKKKQDKIRSKEFPKSSINFLEKEVTFYRYLSDEKRLEFHQWINLFLSEKRITPVKLNLTDGDKLLIASAAIIPVIAFPYYLYPNLTEILIYPSAFDTEYSIDGDGRNVLGMVGEGPMEGKMILSIKALREGFAIDNDHQNTGIHEFIHLIDKQDGQTDGVPQLLLENKLIDSWTKQVDKEIELIFKERSDINPYAATNHAEFLAVIGEYFFGSPEVLAKKHPKLYTDLCVIFHVTPDLERVRSVKKK